ncbi:DUF3108 domain-containing protein [Roseateles sp. NT4]|uniref:DUF3108 domain-containing protein n=1 Tax=Roseateles sp. NT4 TaxID=3453715 RepID=UPI003EEA8627
MIMASGAEVIPTQTLHVGDKLARIQLLTASDRTYLRYTVDGDGKRSAVDIWRRTVSFENAGRDRVMRISQRWDGNTPEEYRLMQESTFRASDMKPIEHRRNSFRAGKSSERTYQFLDGKIIGSANEVTPAMDVKADEPMFNFETDIELLQTLPLARHYSVSIPFYDPGRDPPNRYRFDVIGEDKLKMPDGRLIDAWIVACNYNDKNGPVQRFWFAKQTQVMIQEEVTLPDGLSHFKTLLWDEPKSLVPLKPSKSS